VLEAAAWFQRRGTTDLRFVLVGDGDQMPELRARAAALPNVSFAGWCDGSTLAAILARSDVGLAPYARGVPITLPNKPIEYMAAGLPLLTSLEGELCELVSHERIGVQYTADDVEGLVSAIELLRREPEMRRAMGERSRRVYEERFTADAVYDRFAAHVCAVARHMLND
jgi:glycosyltransferase involved in cell wall biosynthesis